MGDFDDDVLVKRAQGGDMGAYEELVARHRDKIYGRAFSIVRNEDEALDLSQEAWIKGWQRLEQFQGQSSFATWMTRIAINLSLDFLRKAKKRSTTDSMEKLEEEVGGAERRMPPVEVNPTLGLEREELKDRLEAALAQLSEEHRMVLILNSYEDLEYKEIAEKMGCSLGTVMSRLFYARRKMASLMAQWKREEDV